VEEEKNPKDPRVVSEGSHPHFPQFRFRVREPGGGRSGGSRGKDKGGVGGRMAEEGVTGRQPVKRHLVDIEKKKRKKKKRKEGRRIPIVQASRRGERKEPGENRKTGRTRRTGGELTKNEEKKKEKEKEKMAGNFFFLFFFPTNQNISAAFPFFFFFLFFLGAILSPNLFGNLSLSVSLPPSPSRSLA